VCVAVQLVPASLSCRPEKTFETESLSSTDIADPPLLITPKEKLRKYPREELAGTYIINNNKKVIRRGSS
jgi:hypothetical protein